MPKEGGRGDWDGRQALTAATKAGRDGGAKGGAQEANMWRAHGATRSGLIGDFEPVRNIEVFTDMVTPRKLTNNPINYFFGAPSE